MTKAFDHILIVMFENEYRSYVMENPYMRYLASQGVDMANFHGVMHPSQPNYIASLAGELCGIDDDEVPCPPLPDSYSTLVDLMQPRGGDPVVDFKAYMDSYPDIPWNPQWATQPYPADSCPPDQVGPYYQKHNAFASFQSDQAEKSRWRRIVSLDQLWKDLAGDFPQYAWLTPDIWNDGHYIRGTSQAPSNRHLLVNQVADWLENVLFAPSGLNLPGPDSKLPPKTLVVVTFDESDYETNPGGDAYNGPNQIYTVLLGDLDAVEPGTRISTGYNHYSLLRTVEENFGLGSLGKNDAGSNWLRFLWGEEFRWSAPAVVPVPADAAGNFTPVATSGAVAVAGLDETAYLVCQGQGEVGDTTLWWSTLSDQGWSAQEQVGLDTGGPLALAACNGKLFLVYVDAQSGLRFRTYEPKLGWQEGGALGAAGVVSFALTSFAQGSKLMLVGQTFLDSENLYFLTYNDDGDGKWSPPAQLPSLQRVPPKKYTSLALSTLGTTVFLVYQSAQESLSQEAHEMYALTYETASYNTQDEDKQFNVVADIWASRPVPLLYYPGDSDAVRSENYATNGSMAMATLDGQIYLAFSGPDPVDPVLTTNWVYWASYSLNGVLTVQYELPEGVQANGTLEQASWGELERLTGAPLRPAGEKIRGAAAPTGTITMARAGSRLVLVFGPADEASDQDPQFSNSLYYSVGEFK